MAIDPSIPLQAKTPDVNPLATLLQVGQYKYLQQNSNRLQKDTDANMAVGQAIQRNTDGDGSVNLLGVQRDLAGNPAAAYNLQGVTGTNLQQRGQQINNGTAQIQQQGAQLSLTSDMIQHLTQNMGQLLSKPNPTHQDVVKNLLSAGKQFNIPDDVIAGSIARFPQTDDPAQIKSEIDARLQQFQAPAAQANAYQPKPTGLSTGGGTTFVDGNTRTNAGQPGSIGSTVSNTLTPGEASGRLPTVGPDGTPGSIPFSSTVPASLLPPAMQGSGQQAPGRYPQGQPANGGFVPSGLPPGVAEAANVAGQGSGQQLVGDQQAASGSGARVYQLQSALKALATAGTTGPGAEGMNTFKSFLLAQTPMDLGKYLPGVDPQKIASYDEANKYLTQYASAKASALGGGTDSKLATTLSANASTKISGLAAQDVVKANIGLERMQQAQMAAWNASGLPESQYRTWAAKFGSAMDPRVFVADQLDPAHVKKLYDGMPLKEQQQFKAQYNWAVQNGYINGVQ